MPSRSIVTMTVCMWLAVISGWYYGDMNFGHHVVSYYTYQDLATYTNIDPAKNKGQTYMDAGQVYFREGTHIATEDMAAFRSHNTFCAAPIIGQPLRNQGGKLQVEAQGNIVIPESGTVDFWAVGLDCCDPSTRSFHCGKADSKRARAGMRLLRDDQRPFYLLAVQEWTARMCPTSGHDNTASGMAKAAPLTCLPARHPLFFTWVEDPVGEVDGYATKSIVQFRMDSLFFVVLDLFVALPMLWGLMFMGMK